MTTLLLAFVLAAQNGNVVLDREQSAVTWLRSPTSGWILIAGAGEIRGGLLRAPGRPETEASDLFSLTPRDDGALAFAGACREAAPGVMGLALALRGIPDTLEAIVPATSGLHFTKETAQPEFRAEWPISWEAGFILFQGKGEGLLVMSDDRALTPKAVTLRHREGYWDLLLESHNQAPFAERTGHDAPPWLLIPYEGDWRAGVRRYRETLVAQHDLAGARAAQPAWVREIGLCVLLPVDETLLDPLAERCDPSRTLLYVPDWRTFGYDRNYPEYDARPEVKPFIEHAHRLGFRVMPHANYFGLDPLHPLYAQYESYQLRDRDSGDRLWWDWERAEPPIKFAYIHPGCRAWRAELIARLVAAHRALGFDALHIDQTLCIFNHAGGLVDGASCAEGNLLFHKELREALPEVALSGEGLDEVTFVYEAFAQRHVWGIDHANGRWNRPQVECAHPVSSYLFTPHTTLYGYLGMASPSSDQLYGAWRQAYRRMNVIPTIAWPTPEALARPEGFWSLAFREARAWQEQGLTPDPDGDWPAEVCYPYRTSDGRPAGYREDAGTVFTVGGDEVARIVTGVSSLSAPGSIAGWRHYDAEALLGLDPDRWYAYDTAPRSMEALHIEQAPLDARVGVNQPEAGLERIFVTDLAARRDLVKAMAEAECRLTLTDGTSVRDRGSLMGADAFGALAQPSGDRIEFHPAWQARPEGTPARGAVSVTYRIDLPAGARAAFEGRGFVESAAGDRSDGVTFTVTATDGDRELAESGHADATHDRPLLLDLTPLAGGAIDLTLTCDDGGAGDPTCDWARLERPAVTVERNADARLRAVGTRHPFIPPSAATEAAGTLEVLCPYGGAVYLGEADPARVEGLPFDLMPLAWSVSFRQPDGSDRADPGLYAGLIRSSASCGAEERPALHTHPPNEGQTVLQAVVTLPELPCRLVGAVGLRDGSKSEGVELTVSAGGRRVAVVTPTPGAWLPVTADLSALAGETVVLALVTDSRGSYAFDWVVWSGLRLEAK